MSFRGAKEVREGLGLLDELHSKLRMCLHAGQGAFTTKAIFGLAFRACVCGVIT